MAPVANSIPAIPIDRHEATLAVFRESANRPMANPAIISCRLSPFRRIPFSIAILLFGGLLGPACCSLRAAGARQGQTPASEPQLHHIPNTATGGESANEKLVTVYATVRDRHGNVVPTLTRDDFLLEEDGRAQTISTFTAQTDAPLTIGLLVDTTSSQRALLVPERDSSYTLLDHLLAANDAAFVIHFDREVELLQDVTSSRPKLQSALQLLGAPQLNRGDDDANGGNDERRSGVARRHLYDAIWLASNELMKKRPGRKALVVISSGIDRGSRESLTDAIEAAQRADTAVYTIYFAGDEGQQGYERQPRWGASGPAGWPGGGGGQTGGRGNPYPREPRVDGKKILLQISEQTGGMMFELSKKLPLEQIYSVTEEGLRNQYSIAYAPNPPNTDPGYHTIHLTAKQKGLQVQARQGYYSGW